LEVATSEGTPGDTDQMADARTASRPLSPHLQVFRLILTMMMSIVHRITGGALYVGTIFVVWWLVAAASGPEYFAFVNGIYSSWFGRLVLLGFAWALVHHAIGGIRHFIWDFGYGMDKATATRMAQINIVASLAITAVIAVVGILVA
jgi:succinate dehydrogenase / fumarate reductase, cytochrome b subunit